MKRKQTEMYEVEIISIEELKERVGELNRQMDSYEKELKGITQEGIMQSQMDLLVRKYCADIKSVLGSNEFGNVLLKNLIHKILVNEEGNIKVRLNLFSEVALMNG